MPLIDCIISELNKAVSTDDLILLVMGLEWMENCLLAHIRTHPVILMGLGLAFHLVRFQL